MKIPKKKKVLIISLLILFNAISAYSGTLEDVKKAAKQGYAAAQYNLGWIYHNGYGVSQNYKQAIYWYNKAAQQGYAIAQSNLGSIYFDGVGLPQDFKKAVYWYIKAAEQGYAEAQCDLGFMYEYGYGLSQNFKQALYWYKKAAEQGYAEAQYNLGNLFAKGEGVPQDQEQAVYWHTKAEKQGYHLGQFSDNGNKVSQDYESKKNIILLSLILIFVIGFFPPLLIRFIIFKKPITSITLGLGIVVCLWIVNIFLVTVMGNINIKIHGVLVFVTLVSYFILRKGSVKYKKEIEEIEEIEKQDHSENSTENCPRCHGTGGC